ncbi:hypothetical protein GYB22_08135 [bacterium]|nr:hypothetical protein [bacterium]
MSRKSIIFWTFTLIASHLYAQKSDSIVYPTANKGYLFSVHYGYHTPHGDLADRFIPFNAIGGAIEFKTKSNFQFGLSYDWFYGQKVQDTTLFGNMVGPSGQILDEDGNFTVYRLNIQGNYVTANFGYIFNFNKKHPNSGILFTGGVGFMQHKIDIQAPELKVPQINGEYEKGYDRLTYGVATRQFLGYQRILEGRKFRFRAGVELNQGFTQGRRTWNYGPNASGKDQRFDGTFALKFSVILPVYTKDEEDEEFFETY